MGLQHRDSRSIASCPWLCSDVLPPVQEHDLDSMTGIDHNKSSVTKAISRMRHVTASWTQAGVGHGKEAANGMPPTHSGSAVQLQRPCVRIFQGDFAADALTPGGVTMQLACGQHLELRSHAHACTCWGSACMPLDTICVCLNRGLGPPLWH